MVCWKEGYLVSCKLAPVIRKGFLFGNSVQPQVNPGKNLLNKLKAAVVVVVVVKNVYGELYQIMKEELWWGTFQWLTWWTIPLHKCDYFHVNVMLSNITFLNNFCSFWSVAINIIYKLQLLWPPCAADEDIIFCSCGFYILLLLLLFGLFLAVRDWMSIILPHMMWP